MKAIICLMCVAVVAAAPQRGRFVMTYGNSLERGGYPDTSVEWMPSRTMARTRSQRVQDLTRILNSGLMDRSDEWLLRQVMANPARFGNREYFVNGSGEVRFLAPPGRGAGAGAGGASPARGTGVQSV